MRRTLHGFPLAAALVLAVLVLAACSPGKAANQASADAAGPPVSGGTLTWGVETEPITLNPHLYAQAKSRLLVWNSFEALLGYDHNGAIVPWLATAYTATPDGLAYTLQLRTGVTFHDGEKFDAAAVKANLDRLRVAGYAPAVAGVQLRNLDRVEVVDPATVRLVLKRPDVLIQDFLASPPGAMVSPKSLREAKNLKAGGVDVVGTGPFILAGYTAGQQLRYKRNPAYAWAPASAGHQGPAYLDEVVYRFLKEPSVRVGALTSGQVQVIEGVPATDQDLISTTPNLALKRQINSGSAYSYYFNTTRAPFDDIRVRRAFQQAVDVDAVLRSVYRDTATRAWSVINPTSPLYDKAAEGRTRFDAGAANTLLDQAGWSTRDSDGYRTRAGQRLTVRLIQASAFVRDRRDILAQAVQAALKQNAGIDLKITTTDQSTLLQALNANEYELFDNSRSDTDAGAALNLLLASTGSINRTGFKDATLDGLLAQGQATGDQARRLAAYQEIQRLVLVDQALLLPLYAPADQIGAARTVGGVGFEPTAGSPAGAYRLWRAK